MEEDYGAEYRWRVKLAAEASRNCLEKDRQALTFEEFKKGKSCEMR